MTRRQNEAEKRAKQDAREVKSALARLDSRMPQAVVAEPTAEDGRRVWRLRTSRRLEIWSSHPDPPGRWRLEIDIVYDQDIRGAPPFVLKSSVGIHWERDDKDVSFVRYDVDTRDLNWPCHLNVLQEHPLNDRVHYRIPIPEATEWPLVSTVQFLCSDSLRAELTARLV